MNGSRPLLAVVIVAVVACPGIADDNPAKQADAEKKAAELKWAKGVAIDFLDAALGGQLEQAEVLCDEQLKATFVKEGEFRDWLNNSFTIHHYGPATFEAEEIAPDHDEAVLKGTFKDGKPPSVFAIRVVKNKESGMWRVSYCRIAAK